VIAAELVVDVMLFIPSGERAEPIEVARAQPEASQGSPAPAPPQERVKDQSFVASVVQVEQTLAGVQGPVEPLAGAEPVVIRGRAEEDAPEMEIRPQRRQANRGIMILAVQAAAAEEVQC
jgi:hypothetical protein